MRRRALAYKKALTPSGISIPEPSDWINITGNIAFATGKVLIQTDQTIGNAEWNLDVDMSSDWNLQFTITKSPISGFGGFETVQIFRFVDLVNADVYLITVNRSSGSAGAIRLKKNASELNVFAFNINVDSVIRFDFNQSTNVMTYKIDGVLKHTFPNTDFTNDLKIEFGVKRYVDMINIQHEQL